MSGEARGPRPQYRGPPGPRGPPEPVPVRPPVVVDREMTCPLLLKVFYKIGAHHSLEDYAVRGKEPKDTVSIYTWKDANLRELTDLVKEVVPSARRRDARLSFAFVYPDRRGKNVLREVGRTLSLRQGEDDEKTLAGLGFQTGDFLDVAVFV
ncbi:histone deacetylase complex subunit SAP18 [Klebsormidium nitens]|uniref:Histone deacetylase complex subunit SAP18 n=1 Tax=Klebsormidium nitens TaxID=105231 RepID=A0A1Y1I1T2_KLENI|nr:histone deacetylase complex subunit SAP18 [Klebsormidium nitens]|eukprot:GAQ83399.1 histone deacetylase complex subunit SAP18 [Klebsormidium nitens]